MQKVEISFVRQSYTSTTTVRLRETRIISSKLMSFFRCRADDQYCCGYTCCFKPLDDAPKLLESWYFWSLVSLVLIVLGCIIFSFALSNLKRKSSSWTRAPSGTIHILRNHSHVHGFLTSSPLTVWLEPTRIKVKSLDVY